MAIVLSLFISRMNTPRELSQEEYKKIRDEALDSTYGKGFVDQYTKNK